MVGEYFFRLFRVKARILSFSCHSSERRRRPAFSEELEMGNPKASVEGHG
jgi:hypothetical protein